MKIISSTDSQHIGINIGTVVVGDTVSIGDFSFIALSVVQNGNQVFISCPNYQIICEV